MMRAGSIIDRVSLLYRRGTPKRELTDLNEIVHEMGVLLGNRANRNAVSIRTDLDPQLPPTTADRVQLQQVLMNLMLNGIEAMQDTGGVLTVASKRIEDGQLLISVSDTGVGLSTDEAERIFDAFITTKPQGTGMGLSISRRIVESHGGHLRASPNTGRGATFQFTLPVEATASSSPVAV
jgi:signal transduction histidine kinase